MRDEGAVVAGPLVAALLGLDGGEDPGLERGVGAQDGPGFQGFSLVLVRG